MPKRKTMPKQKPQVVSIEPSFAENLLAQIRQEAMAAAMTAVREELKGAAKPTPEPPVSRAEPEEREPGPPVGKPWSPGPGSRYVEPGTRVSKRGRLDSKPAKSKVMSAFIDPEILGAFGEKCARYGITKRFGLEQAMTDWIKKPGVGEREREVDWRK